MFRKALLATALFGVPLAATAQPVNGLYIGGGLGINLMQDETDTISAFGVTGKVSLHPGPVGVVSAGWGFGNGLRVELEGDFRQNQFYAASGFGASSSAGGREQKFGPMVNAVYDFNGLSPWIVPYVGAGIGYQLAYLQGGSASSPGVTASIGNATKGAFAYQAILGGAVPISAVPGLALTAEYRFMGLTGSRSYNMTVSVGPFTVPSTAKLQDDYNHAFLIGFRYAFGAAPPPPAPAPMAAPAPAPARSYLVFFDWDKATLTARAQQIIKEAADNSTKVQYTRIEVNGYTDTSGTPQYNQGLSVRRAQAVAAELVKDGVPKNAIAIQGFGETHLLVPTGPGVREPQNRRVEIIIR